MMVQGPKRCGICSAKKQPRAVFYTLIWMRRFCARPSRTIAASQDMSATAIRQWVGDVIRVEGIHAAITSGPTIPERETAQRLEDKLAEEQDIFILAASETGISFRIRPPRLSLESTAVMSMQKTNGHEAMDGSR